MLGTGVQWGKTQSGALWMRRKVCEFVDEEDNFLITAPNYKIFNQSTLPHFLRAMEGMGKYSKTDALFKTHWGTHVWLRTATDPDSVVGIPKVRAVWGDEAGLYPLYFWQNIEARAAPMNADIMLTTSPYSLNWIWRDLIKPAKDGLRPDVTYIHARSVENPYFSAEAYEKRRKTMDPRRFAMMYGGEFGRMSGLVYDCWDDEQNYISPFELPTGTRYVAGIDWGFYPDPFVLKIRAITPDGRHYGVSEFVKTGMRLPQIVDLCKQKKQVFGVTQFYCDPSQPGSIEELNVNGLAAQGADNDIRRGIDLHYELIKLRKYKEFTGSCPHTANERESYHYPEPKDLKPDQASKELLPVDQHNHTMDCDRYLTISTYTSSVKLSPKSPQDSQLTPPKNHTDRIEWLKRTNKRRAHAEKWS